MTFLDLFAGVGGFRKGMEQAGHKCVGFCEWDGYARASYISMHCITEEQRKYLATLDLKKRQKEILKDEYLNGEWCSNDIRTVDATNIPKADCWCFGAPCQDFSIAGCRKGLDGDRSSLVREVFRILGEMRQEDKPRWLIYENVKGMLSSNRGFDFLSILIELDERGYDTEWQIFNSKDFGVPQNRERVYAVGHFRETDAAKILPISGTNGKNSIQVNDDAHINIPISVGAKTIQKEIDIAHCLNAEGSQKEGVLTHQAMNRVVIPVLTPEREKKRQNGRRFKENGEPSFTLTAHCLNASDQQKIFGANQSRTMVGVLRQVRSEYGKEIRKNYEAGNMKISRHDFLEHEIREDGISNTIDTVQKDNLVAIPLKEATKNGYAEAHKGDEIVLTAPDSKIINEEKQFEHPGVIVDIAPDCHVYARWYEKYNCYIAIRRLTPKECFRLQGWSDDYFEKAQFVNSDSQLYKQAGNGVTVNVVYEIGKRIN